MKLSKSEFDAAVAAVGLEDATATTLWGELERRTVKGARLDGIMVAYYFGALVTIGAMSWFMNLGWEAFNGLGIVTLSLAYALIFVLVGRYLAPTNPVPAGLLYTTAVVMTPLAVYGLERWLGIWPQADPGVYRDFHMWIKGGWFAMEAATLAVGAIAWYLTRFPFSISPVAFTLWYVSMDLAPLLYGPEVESVQRADVSIGVGVLMLAMACGLERISRRRQDAFWLYLFGLMAIYGGASVNWDRGWWYPFALAVLHVAFYLLGVIDRRRVFTVFGALGALTFGAAFLMGYQEHHLAIPLGAIILAAAYVLDLRSHRTAAFWGYLGGMIAFWGGLTEMDSGNQWARFGYCMLNVGFIGLSAILQQRVFAVFGALGVFGYLSYLAYEVFAKSPVFPFVLSGLGLAIIVLTVVVQRNQKPLEEALQRAIPPWLRACLPAHLSAHDSTFQP